MSLCRTLISALMLAALVAGGSLANEVYRWVDKDGNVHYSDRPPEEGRVDVMDMPKSPPPSAGQTAAVTEARETELTQWEHAQQSARKRAEEEAAQESEETLRAENCEKARVRLASYSTARRVYEELEGGGRRYLTDGELSAAREGAQEAVDKWCDWPNGS